MRLSRFNFNQQNDQHWVVYNSASSNCIVLTDQAYNDFINMTCEEGDRQYYRLLGFYVDDDFDEVNSLIENSKYRLNNFSKKKFRVLTTTCCNARCPYCYEAGVNPVTMSDETARAVADFILTQSKGLKTVEIEWFGGEPLLNVQVIDLICNRIMEKKPSELKFESSIVSNGYLIDDSIVQRMVERWKLYQIQITLDGMSDEYERVKALGKGSFDKVIRNISVLCAAGIHVVVRLNFDNNNVAKLHKLIEYLSLLPFKDQLEVYPAKINDGAQRTDFALESETMQMYRILHDYGFIRRLKLLPRTMKTPCAASHRGYYTINANGLLFKCDRKLLAGNAVGSVFEPNQINTKAEQEWESFVLPKKCLICKMTPLCWGGCIYERINGQDYCYITEKIVNNNLRLILEDYLKEILK